MPSPGTSGMMAGISKTVTGSFQMRAKISLNRAISTVARKLAEKECTEKSSFMPIKASQPRPPMSPLRHKIRFGPWNRTPKATVAKNAKTKACR